MSTPGYIYPVVTPADVEWLACLYLTPLLTPTLVATRLPDDTSATDTVNGFLRVEAGSGTKANYTEYNQQILLHGYAAREYEQQAYEVCCKAVAWMSAAGGQTIGGRFIVEVPHATVPARRTDPEVNLPRYQAWVTWKITGQPVGITP